MGKEMLKQADDWLKSMLEIASEQKEAETIEHMKQRIKVQKWLMKQAERVWELENQNKELEYASKYNGELNEFLQKRKLPPNTLGRHVVDVVMDYVQELENQVEWIVKNRDLATKTLDEQNKRYREYFRKIISVAPMSPYGYRQLAKEALEGEE